MTAENQGTNTVARTGYALSIRLLGEVFLRFSIAPAAPISPAITSPDFFNKPEKVSHRSDEKELVLQRRIAKYVVLPFVFGCARAIVVGSSHHVVRFKLFANIALPRKPSL